MPVLIEVRGSRLLSFVDVAVADVASAVVAVAAVVAAAAAAAAAVVVVFVVVVVVAAAIVAHQLGHLVHCLPHLGSCSLR